MKLTHKARILFAPLKPEIERLCEFIDCTEPDDAKLGIQIEAAIGPKIIEHVCEREGMYRLGCLQIAVLMLKESEAFRRAVEQRGGARSLPPAKLDVLLVEDDPLTQKVMSRILELHDFRVTAVGTVKDAIGHLSSSACEPDFVLLDLMLPDGSGTDVQKFIQAHGIASTVIVVSAVADQMPEAVELHPAAIIPKPLDLTQLVSFMKTPVPPPDPLVA